MGRKTNITIAQPERGEISAGGITASNGPPGTNTPELWHLDGSTNQRATGFTPVGGSLTDARRNRNHKDKSTQRAPTGRNPLSPVRGTVLRQEPKSRWPAGAPDREIQPDPIGYPDEPQSVDNESGQALGGINLYEYVAGRAVVFTDPAGLDFCDDLKENIAEFQREIAANLTAAFVHTLQLLLAENNWERFRLGTEIAGEEAEAVPAKAAPDSAQSLYDLFCNNPTGICPIIIPEGSPLPAVDWRWAGCAVLPLVAKVRNPHETPQHPV